MRASINMWRLILISLLGLLNISPDFISFWEYNGEKLERVNAGLFNRADVQFATWAEGENWRGEVFCVLPQGEGVQIGVCEKDSQIAPWRSPAGWQVREIVFSDLNLDGEEELALLVWRPFQVWPVDRFLPSGGRIAAFHNQENMSCHLILIGLVNGEIQELWAGSALADPIRDLHVADLDGDGTQELIALEYAYDSNPLHSSLTIWSWNGFGFSLQDRQEGDFTSLIVLSAASGKVLLAH